jgi:hypothetical protein
MTSASARRLASDGRIFLHGAAVHHEGNVRLHLHRDGVFTASYDYVIYISGLPIGHESLRCDFCYRVRVVYRRDVSMSGDVEV